MGRLKRIQEKWAPVFRPNARQNKDSERIQEKWAPVFRPNARQNKDSERIQEKYAPAKAGVATGFPGNTLKRRRI